MKKQSNLSQLMGYAGGHRYLTYSSLLLSAVSAVLALFPFVFLFFIIREVIEVSPDYAQAVHVVRSGWMAVLFSVLSILENVRLSRPSASRQEVERALHEAQCDDIIAKLPQGIDTVIGAKGVYLSGGERQRISIVRALLKDAPIILLDEATASLDAENETDIQQAISRLVERKTVLIIAHRMRTVENADKIVVLANGTVAETGTPEELLQKSGVFARMVKLQTERRNWALA